jgi:hypothetical protein
MRRTRWMRGESIKDAMNQSARTPIVPIVPIFPIFPIFLRKDSQPEPWIDSGCLCEAGLQNLPTGRSWRPS